MISESLGEMFKGDSADTFVSMGGQADTSSVRRWGARTTIGASGNFCIEELKMNEAEKEVPKCT